MARFAQTMLNILDLHSVVAMHILLVSVCLEKFLDTLYSVPPENMDQLRAKATRYISIEENADA